MRLGTLKTAFGSEYAFTEEDALWSARMCVGEGETSLAGARIALACMVRRFAVIGMTNSRITGARSTWLWPTLTRLLIGTAGGTNGYSQPIAYQWRSRGTPAQIERRARIRSLSWDEIPTAAKSATKSILGSGALPGGPAVHFADLRTTNASLAQNPTWQVVDSPASNLMVSTSGSRAYRQQFGSVRVRGRCIFGGNQ